MNGFAQYLSLDLPQVPHKNIHKRRRDAGEACKKVKRQKLYKYIFIIIISTCNIKTMSKLLQNYSSISNSYAQIAISNVYSKWKDLYTMIYNHKVIHIVSMHFFPNCSNKNMWKSDYISVEKIIKLFQM